jgi:hypothetical protein
MESRTTRAADGDFSMMPTTPTSNQQQQNEQQQIIQQMLEENRARLEQIVQRVSQLDAEDAAKKEGHRHTN